MNNNRIDLLEKELQELRKENLRLHKMQQNLSRDIVIALIVFSIVLLMIFFRVV